MISNGSKCGVFRNGDERKMVLTELKHVIDTQPTCLYEDDYQEFKKSGLLNPTKEDIRVR